MSPLPRHRLENNLVRWVQRHAGMATLFRSPALPRSAISGFSMTAPFEQASAPLDVQDRPVSPPQNKSRASQIVRPRMEGPAPTIPDQHASLTQAQNVLQTSLPARATEASKKPEQEDRNWQRLQRIVQKHEEQEVAATPESKPDSVEPLVLNSASENEQPAQENHPSPRLQMVSRKHDPQQLVKTEGAQESAQQSMPQQELSSTSSPIASHNKRSDPKEIRFENEPPKTIDGPDEIITPQASNHPVEPVQRMHAIHNDPPAKRMLPAQETNLAAPQEPFSQTFSQPSNPAVFEQPSVSHELPLESIWPVQRVADSEPVSNDISLPSAPGLAESASYVEIESSGQERQTAPLQRVQRGAKSSDGINQAQTLPVDEADSISAPRSIASQPVEILPPSRPRPFRSEVATSPVPIIQRREEGAPNRQQPPQTEIVTETIPTAIGPLPADLWKLLGQPSPDLTPSNAGSSPPAQATTKDSPVQAEMKSDAKIQRSQPTVIQRQDDAAPSKPPGEDAGKAQESASNLDELAQRVYAEIRHRLAMEWERMRRR